MSEFFGKPVGGHVNMGINSCCIHDFKEVTDKAKEDYAFELELGFEGTGIKRNFKQSFAFDRDEKKNIQEGDRALKRFYRFLDFLGITNIGLNEKGQIIDIEGKVLKEYTKAIGIQLRYSDEDKDYSYLCFIEPNHYKGKVYQRVRFLCDATNSHATKEMESLIVFIQQQQENEKGNTQTSEEDNSLPS